MAPVSESDQPPVAGWSLVEGGALYRAARACGLPPGVRGLRRLGFILALIAWLPLLLFTAIEGVLTGGTEIPFLSSAGTHTRFLLAIPLFFVAESLFGPRIEEVLRKIVDAGIVRRDERPAFTAELQRMRRWSSAWLPDILLFILSFGAISLGLRTDLPLPLTTWREWPADGLTMAGWWNNIVSLPLFQFLLLRWTFRLLLWARVLWRVARLNLRLMPTHPDLAGGLGGLGVAHVDLVPLAVATNAVFAATLAEQIRFGGHSLEAFSLMMAGAVAGQTLLLVAPLLFFIPQLLEVKQRGLLEYGAMAAVYVRAFDRKWLGADPPRGDHMLGSADLQSLADLGGSFQTIGSMRVLPMALRQLVVIAVASALPFAPLAVLVVPLNEIVVRIFRSVAGV